MKTVIHSKLMIIYLFLSSGVFANNLTVTNAKLVGSNQAEQYTMVQFDISWENSWRTSAAPNNRDAVWVFIKFRISGGSWQHAWLNSSGHTAPTGCTIDIGLLTPDSPFNSTTNPGLGAFIYRSADGTGTFSLTGVQLRWNYGANGCANADVADVQVYAMEMVYIPQASFYVGSGGTESGSFTDGSWSAGNTIPYQITSEDAMVMDSVPGSLFAKSAISTIYPGTTRPVTLPASFPKGYKAFYCMKHAITQQGYANFLNTLTRTQQASRVATVLYDTTTWLQRCYVMRNSSTINFRQGIRCDTAFAPYIPLTFVCDYAGGGTLQYVPPPINATVLRGNWVGGEANDGLGNECNWLSWLDVLAYLDWSGLRPMTELEYEKVCRGDQAPVANEYVWGSTTGATAPTGLTNSGEITETASNAGANQSYNAAVWGTMRVGAFAGAGTTREQAGATYYGVLDLGGSTWHMIVPVAKPLARAFTGDHGNGLLNSSGHNDVASWPGTGGYNPGSTSLQGYGFRGGTWYRDASYLTTSSRGAAASGNGLHSFRHDSQGGRGVRTAP
ncbi:MAG: hypothetical protein HYU69_09250 [Bacteroidetes bacterium]|nr:hypothetical protein [Bacteroidota bacterium]